MNLADMLGAAFRAAVTAARAVPPPAPVPAPVAEPRQAAPTKDLLSFAQRQIDLALLCIAFPANRPGELAKWVKPTQDACFKWGIDEFREVASFLANINVESAGLTRLEESLNYSVDALIAKFGRHRISVADAQRYGRKTNARGIVIQRADQQALANILYGGEWGRVNLGNTQPTDGWDCRGFGPKQVTGRRNQTRFAQAMGMTLPQAQAYMRTPEGGMMAAGWFWQSHDLDAKAATPGVRDDRIAINGGTFGLAEVEIGFDRLIEELLRREREQ